MSLKKIFFITTVPISLFFYKGQLDLFKSFYEVEVVSSGGRDYERFCSESNVSGHEVSMRREISFFRDILSLFTLVILFYKKKPDVIHGSTPKAGLLSMLAGFILRVPVRIYYIHGLRYEGAIGLKRYLLECMEKLSCRLATDVFSVSQGVKNQLISDGICRKEVKIIWNGSVNGIDWRYFNPDLINEKEIKQKYEILPSSFVLGYVGRLVGDKGIHLLVEAFLTVLENNSKSKLLLVGSFEQNLDPLDVTVLKEIKENESIIHVGYQADIRPFLKIMDVFVFPSYREGFGISLLEAAAMGTPAICSKIIGCDEIICDGVNGLLIEPKSVSSLKNSLLSLMNSPALLKEMGDVTRKIVVERYDQDQLWEKTLISYREIIDS